MTRQQLTATLVTTIGLLLVALAAGGRAVALGQPLHAGRLPPPADLGSGFTYQGFLEDNGNPINGSCDFLFELRDSETGGSQVGLTDTEMNVTVQEGAFTVQLNDTGQFGPDAFAGQPRWLEVAMRCPAGTGNYTILSPRQPLTAVPYALGLQPGVAISGTINSGTLNLANGSGPGLVINSAAGDGILVHSAGNPSFHVGCD